jgi:hypothetical protein
MKLARLLLAALLVLGDSQTLAEGGELSTAPHPSSATYFLDTDLASPFYANANGSSDETVSQLDDQIAALTEERRRVRLTGPIIVTSIGGVLTVGGAVTAGAAAAACSQASSDRFTSCDQDARDAFIIAGSVIAGAGVIMVIAGAASIASRKNQRRAIDGQILDLEKRRQSILDSVDYGFDFRGGKRMVTMRLDF